MGAMLALLAVLGMIALSTWHGSNVQDEDTFHVASVQHVHDAGFDDEADSPIHVAAHSAGHGLAIPSSAGPLPRLALHGQDWPKRSTVVLSGLDPGSILRPPRA